MLVLPLGFLARHWFFGVIIAVLSVSLVTEDPEQIDASLILIAAMNTLGYPYARFLYSWLIKTVMGGHRVSIQGKWVWVWVLYIVTVAVMLWSVSVLVAPIGMLVLYFIRKDSKVQGSEY